MSCVLVLAVMPLPLSPRSGASASYSTIRRSGAELLDLLYVCATGRAAYALFRFAFGSGDPQNAYRVPGVKVALWDSADHLLFAFLIAVVMGAWVTERVGGRRLAFWASGSALMALTTVLSFRRSDWFGLIAALALATIVLLRRRERAVVLLPGAVRCRRRHCRMELRSIHENLRRHHRASPTRSRRADRVDAPVRVGSCLAYDCRQPRLGKSHGATRGRQDPILDTDVVHNAFLFAWMKLGLAGLLSLVALAASCVIYAVRGVKARGPEEHIALGVLSVVPFGLVLCFFESALLSFRTLSVLALAGALAVRVATAPDEPQEVQIRTRHRGTSSVWTG